MPNFPVRELGSAGIVTDVHPYDLPPNVFSSGVNVRFSNGSASRGPVMREVFDLTAHDPAYDPAHILTVPSIGGAAEKVVVVNRDYSEITSIIGTVAADVTPTGVFVGDTEQPFTHSFLGDVVYLNRQSDVPYKLAQGDSTFVALPNWDPTWRCRVLRPYKDFLLALNVSKGANDYPTMIKWSNNALYGSAPDSWDETDPTKNAGENVLNEMKTPLIDGLTLRDTFMLYADNEVWAMTYTGSGFIFDFRKRFDDFGVINTNCVVEIDGKHYVFGKNDIIVHDGATKDSIVHGRNKKFIFDGLVKDLEHYCFVTHNPKLTEIMFCYPSRDQHTGFDAPEKGCNRAAIFNYRENTWTFEDLPNVTSATFAQLSTAITWDSPEALTPWNEMGGTWSSESDQADRHHMFTSSKSVNQGISKSRILGRDLITQGLLTRPVVPELLKDVVLERIGVDLDETQAELSSYKSIQKVYPQVAVYNGSTGVSLQFGSSDYVGAEPAWGPLQSFEPATQHQLSVRTAGRYLSYRLRHTGLTDFSFSGFDVLMTKRGKQ